MSQFLPVTPTPLSVASTSQIRLVLVDDQPFALRLLTSYFENNSHIEIVGTSTQGSEGLKLIATTRPDLVLLDIEMPDMDGLTLTRLITQKFKQTKVLLLSSHDQSAYIKRALEAGAQGYLLKGTPAEELVLAVQLIHQGYLHLGPGLFEKLESFARSEALLPDSSTLTVEVGDATAMSSMTPSSDLAEPMRLAPSESNPVAQSLSSAIQEQLNTLPQVWSRGLLYGLIVCTGIALPWAMISKVDETGVARGRLEPQGETLRLDSQIAGRVSMVRVQEGDHVKQGQVLLEFESEDIQANLKRTETQLDGQQQRLQQLKFLKTQILHTLAVQAQQNQAQQLEKTVQIDQAQDQVSVSRSNIELQLAEKQAQIDQAQSAITFATESYESASDRYRRDLAEVQRYQTLEDKGVVSAVQVVEAQRLADDSQRQRDQAKVEITQAKQRLQEQQKSYDRLAHQLKSEYQKTQSQLQEQEQNEQGLRHGGALILSKNQEQLNQLDSEMAGIEAEIQQSKTELKALAQQLEKYQMRSPISGVIFQLPVKKAEVYLEPGSLIAQIAPAGLPLILKAQMPNTESGFMKVGLPVKLKFDAYPFQDYGVVPGQVRWIAPDSKRDLVNPNGVDYFELEIALEQTFIQGKQHPINLSSGQTATAEVIIRQRRVIDYILDPFKQLQSDGIKL